MNGHHLDWRLMTPEERLAYEARVRTRQVVLAAAAGILLMVAVVIQLGGPHVKVNEQTLGLVTENKRFTRDLIGSIISAIGFLSLAVDARLSVGLHARA